MATGESMSYDDSLDASTHCNLAVACPHSPATVRSSGHDNESNGVTVSDWKSGAAHLLLSNNHTAGSMDESNFPANRKTFRPIAPQLSSQSN